MKKPQKALANKLQKKPQKRLQIFDPPMCCSTGVCGPEVDPKLARFAADIDWLKRSGASKKPGKCCVLRATP